jgi:hypothetical protein
MRFGGLPLDLEEGHRGCHDSDDNHTVAPDDIRFPLFALANRHGACMKRVTVFAGVG